MRLNFENNITKFLCQFCNLCNYIRIEGDVDLCNFQLCVGSPIRQRRGQQLPLTPSLPSQAARSVAKALNGLLTRGLSWDKLPPSPIPKFRLTFLICSVGFTSPMLFDEKRHPYHLMLQTFVHSGGQTAFFA